MSNLSKEIDKLLESVARMQAKLESLSPELRKVEIARIKTQHPDLVAFIINFAFEFIK